MRIKQVLYLLGALSASKNLCTGTTAIALSIWGPFALCWQTWQGFLLLVGREQWSPSALVLALWEDGLPALGLGVGGGGCSGPLISRHLTLWLPWLRRRSVNPVTHYLSLGLA